MEQIKYKGNENGMSAELYADSVVSKLVRGKHGAEIWEGHLAWYLRFVVTVCPLAVMVCIRRGPNPEYHAYLLEQNWIFARYYNLKLLKPAK